MKRKDTQNNTPNKTWLKFLAIWAVGASAAVVSLVIAIVAFVMPAGQPNPLGEKYFELIAAGHAPLIYRLAIMFDMLAWIGWGGLFVAFAVLLRHAAPWRSKFLCLLAVSMSIGLFGACLRIIGTPEMASQYLLALPAAQPAIVQSYDNLLSSINLAFSLGGLLTGTALVLVMSTAKYLSWIPSWSLILIGIAGAVHVVKAGLELMLRIDLGPLALLANILLVIASITIAIKSCQFAEHKN